jgi:type I restriction enzyme M protein
VGKVGIVPTDVPEPGPGGWVAGRSAIGLRCKQDAFDPRAIEVQLGSETGQNVLKLATTGATIRKRPAVAVWTEV